MPLACSTAGMLEGLFLKPHGPFELRVSLPEVGARVTTTSQ